MSDGVYMTGSFLPAAVAYLAGDLISVAQKMEVYRADGSPVTSGSLLRILTSILRIDVAALQSGEGAYTLHLYKATPPSAQADNAAWTLASGDLAVYMGFLSLGTPVDAGGALMVKATGLNYDVRLDSNEVWGVLVTNAGFTATAVAREVEVQGFVI